MRTWIKPAVLLLVALAGVPSMAATYYVRPGGSDSCSGTVDGDYTGSGSACAFKTIDKCDAAVRAGDTCQVAAGTYSQTLNPANSGSSDVRTASYRWALAPPRDMAIDLPLVG